MRIFKDFMAAFSMVLNAYRSDDVMAVAWRDDLSMKQKAGLITKLRDEAMKGE